MEEGREGARTKVLQKSNRRYRGRLTTPRNHPHPSTDNERPGVCEFARAHLVPHSTMVLRPDKNCVHLCSPNRKTQLNTNHPRVLIPKF